MNRPTLVSTVGLPRSGKSTWAMQQGIPVVNPDSIRLALHGQAFYAPAEPMVWTVAHLMVASLFRAGHERVILDATNVSPRRRAEWISKEWANTYICFPTPKEECIRRALVNGQADLVPIIERMDRDLTWPETDTAWEEKYPGGSNVVFRHYQPEPVGA